MKVRIVVCGITALLIGVACSKGEKTGATADTGQAAAPSAAPTSAAYGPGPIQPQSGGKVIVVNLISNEKGNFFQPNEIEAHKGDVVRYTLQIGVHNVHFIADSSSVKTAPLPPPSEMLQLPGQTFDVLVDFPEGKYYFQCDPHAALGMHGYLKVED